MYKQKALLLENSAWRREGDSNPRYGYPYDSLANCWFKPLTHLTLPYLFAQTLCWECKYISKVFICKSFKAKVVI